MKYFFILLISFTATFSLEPDQCIQFCLEYSVDLNKTVAQNIISYFEEDGPSDGVCLTGEKVIYNGSYFGYPDEIRCVCKDDIISQYTNCSAPNVPICPPGIPIYTGETAGAFLSRLMRSMMNIGVSDGCCLPGYQRYLTQVTNGTQTYNLCYCASEVNPPIFPGEPIC